MQRTFRRAIAVLALAGALAMPLPHGFSAASDLATCAGRHVEPGIGVVCPRANGLFEVVAPDGVTSLGFVHGTDPVPAGGALDSVTPVFPVCAANPTGDYDALAIYARASDDADNFATDLPKIRDLVNQTNGHLRMEGNEFGVEFNYRFQCSRGQVDVRNEVLPTLKASASFSTIVADLKAKGYSSYHVKYVVWYDDPGACPSCSGTGHIYDDDSNNVNNFNNGPSNAEPLFGVNFGYLDYLVTMHENGHNMGAVQTSAGNATLRHHCNDGLDVMCYADGASNSHYDPNVCTDRKHFDCGHDDYFRPNPTAGSYLATHWNVGGSLNRFLTRGNVAPVMAKLDCSPNPANVGDTVTCKFSASDDSAGLFYTVTWGDGSPNTRVPATGTIAPGSTESATHAYSAAATLSVSVSATDDAALASAGMAFTQTIQGANGAPAMQSLSCSPNPAGVSQSVTCTFSASDDSSGVYYTVDWGDGGATTRVPSTGTVAPGTTQSATHAWSAAGSYTVSTTATDNASPPLTSPARTFAETVSANGVPVMQSLSCAPNPATPSQSVTCSFSASDDSTGVYYTIGWGDGSASVRVPATGTVAPGSTQSASHAWSALGTFTVSATATDNGSPALTSAARTTFETIAPPPCSVSRSFHLRVGLAGQAEFEGISSHLESGIPASCAGHTFHLGSQVGQDFNVCWYAGAVELACFAAFGNDQGAIPSGATEAHVLYNVGFDGTYVLTAS